MDIGPIQLPVLPPYIVLTARTSTVQWTLVYNPNGGTVGISTTLPPKGVPFISYAAFEEPYIFNAAGARAQLAVNLGVLGIGPVSTDPTIVPGNGIVVARNGLNATFAQVILSLSTPYTFTFTLVTA